MRNSWLHVIPIKNSFLRIVKFWTNHANTFRSARRIGHFVPRHKIKQSCYHWPRIHMLTKRRSNGIPTITGHAYASVYLHWRGGMPTNQSMVQKKSCILNSPVREVCWLYFRNFQLVQSSEHFSTCLRTTIDLIKMSLVDSAKCDTVLNGYLKSPFFLKFIDSLKLPNSQIVSAPVLSLMPHPVQFSATN